MQRLPTPLTAEEIKERRRKSNQDLLERVASGEVPMGNSLDTWFPPRPTIAKDPSALKKIFGVVSQDKSDINKEDEENNDATK